MRDWLVQTPLFTDAGYPGHGGASHSMVASWKGSPRECVVGTPNSLAKVWFASWNFRFLVPLDTN